MCRDRRFSRVLIAVILGSVSVPVPADDVESGLFGEQIVPVDSKAIRMASEEVDVYVRWARDVPEDKDVRPGHAAMRVVGNFVLVNDSDKPQTILVSFPADFYVRRFTRTVDGRPLKVEEHPGKKFGNTSKINFAPRQQRRVRVTYMGYSGNTGGEYAGGGWWRYILTTGAKWKGKISKAVVRMHFPEGMPILGRGPFQFDLLDMTPAGYTTEGRTATWVFKNFEPTEDVAIEWTNVGALMTSRPFLIKSKKEASALLLEQGRSYAEDGHSRYALGAFAAIREFYPDSPEARKIDYAIARVFAVHHVNCDWLGKQWHLSLGGIDANRAIRYYEAALKQPLDPEQRTDALSELFFLYSVEAPDAAKARGILERLKKETIEHTDEWLMKVAAVSPRKALTLLDGIRPGPDRPGSMRHKLETLLKLHPNGLVGAKGRPQAQPGARPPTAKPAAGKTD